MNNSIAIGLGIASFAAGCAAVALIEGDKTSKFAKQLDSVSTNMHYIRNNIDISVPESMADMLVRDAATKVANTAVENGSRQALKDIESHINSEISKAVSSSYEAIEKGLQDKLEKEINLQTIERIENAVSEKVSKQVLNTLKVDSAANKALTKADVIKACVDKGMKSWEISDVVSAFN